MDRNGDHIYNLYFKIPFILRKPGVAIFGAIIKIVTMFIKTIKDSRKVKRIRNYVSKSNRYLYFFDVAKFADFQ